MSKEAKRLLSELKLELRRLECWREMPPSPEALSSTTPFCMDTMGFTQWLQWIFMPRVQAILDHGAELPKGSDIKPYAEEALRVEKLSETDRLLKLIEEFDVLMS